MYPPQCFNLTFLQLLGGACAIRATFPSSHSHSPPLTPRDQAPSWEACCHLALEHDATLTWYFLVVEIYPFDLSSPTHTMNAPPAHYPPENTPHSRKRRPRRRRPRNEQLHPEKVTPPNVSSSTVSGIPPSQSTRRKQSRPALSYATPHRRPQQYRASSATTDADATPTSNTASPTRSDPNRNPASQKSKHEQQHGGTRQIQRPTTSAESNTAHDTTLLPPSSAPTRSSRPRKGKRVRRRRPLSESRAHSATAAENGKSYRQITLHECTNFNIGDRFESAREEQLEPTRDEDSVQETTASTTSLRPTTADATQTTLPSTRSAVTEPSVGAQPKPPSARSSNPLGGELTQQSQAPSQQRPPPLETLPQESQAPSRQRPPPLEPLPPESFLGLGEQFPGSITTLNISYHYTFQEAPHPSRPR